MVNLKKDIICDVCETVDTDLYTTFDGHKICYDCCVKYYTYCPECGKYHYKNNCIEWNGVLYCYECACKLAETKLIKCEYCGATCTIDDIEVVDNVSLCPDCIEEHTRSCDYCGDRVICDDAVCVDESVLCQYCYDNEVVSCECCGDEHLIDDMRYVDYTGGYVCEDCLSDYVYCNDCDTLIHVDDAVYIDGDYYCPDCAEEHRSILGDYHHTYATDFYGDDSTKYFGIELEVDDGDDNETAVSYVKDILGEAFTECKYDGSLNCGFEITTQPATMYYHIYDTDYETLFKKLSDLGYTSHDNKSCGLHIHINKDYFVNDTSHNKELTVGKLWVLFTRFRDKIERISRRKNFFYCGFIDNIINADKAETIVKKQWGRYYAINNENSATIEFRIFKGTLKYSTFIATLEFVDIITTYVNEHSFKECCWVNWNTLFKNASEVLKNYFNERGIN